MSNPRKPPSPPPEALRKLAQLQIERLKKEEEEEQWISGEELYTEGSSDEDDAALREKRRANEGKGAKKTINGTPCKDKKQNLKPRLTSDNTNVSSELVPGIPLKESQFQNLTLSEKADEDSKCDKSSAKSPEHREENAGNYYLSDLNEEQSEISWRPKRGSIKLPNLTSEGEIGENKFPSVLRDNVQINLDANNNEAEQPDEEEWHEKKDIIPDIPSADEDAASANEEEDNKKGVKTVKKKLPHFILRNIKLASEGMGTLSITDEEKERLSKLLKDIDIEDQEKKKTDEKGDALNDTNEDETEYVRNHEEYGGYTMDPEVEQNLKEIDSKLELLSSNGSVSGDTSHQNINIGHCQENVGDEIKDDNRIRGWKEAKLKKRLHEIDQSLLIFTQPVEEPVEPLRETEMHKLVEELSSGHSSSAVTESETSLRTAEDASIPTIPLRERTFDSVATYGSKGSELRNDFTPSPMSTNRTTATPPLSTERSDEVLRWPPQLKSEVVQQLVEQAKALMPYFKFKHTI